MRKKQWKNVLWFGWKKQMKLILNRFNNNNVKEGQF